MKRYITSIAAMLAAVICLAQNSKTIPVSIEARVSAAAEFYSELYGAYYELPRTGVLLQAGFGPVIIGAGYDTVFVRDAGNEGAVNFRIGFRYKAGTHFSGDVYVSAEKTVKSDYPMPTMAGIGTSLSVKLAGPLHLFTDIRYHHHLFSSGYERYRTRAGVIAIGLNFKF